jgi:hypothetical protein
LLWAAHEVRSTHAREKRVQHPEVGVMELQCQFLHRSRAGADATCADGHSGHRESRAAAACCR